MGKGPDTRGREKQPRAATSARLTRRAASLGGVKRKRCRRCIVPFVEDAALEASAPAREASPPAAKRVKRQARVRTDEEKAALASARNPSSCSCSSGDEQ